jgi:uncharacterized membrane protein YeiH
VATSRGERPADLRTRALAVVAVAAAWLFLVIGDTWSPAHWISAAIGLMVFTGRGGR